MAQFALRKGLGIIDDNIESNFNKNKCIDKVSDFELPYLIPKKQTDLIRQGLQVNFGIVKQACDGLLPSLLKITDKNEKKRQIKAMAKGLTEMFIPQLDYLLTPQELQEVHKYFEEYYEAKSSAKTKTKGKSPSKKLPEPIDAILRKYTWTPELLKTLYKLHNSSEDLDAVLQERHESNGGRTRIMKRRRKSKLTKRRSGKGRK
jgi:hypothetical protein